MKAKTRFAGTRSQHLLFSENKVTTNKILGSVNSDISDSTYITTLSPEVFGFSSEGYRIIILAQYIPEYGCE